MSDMSISAQLMRLIVMPLVMEEARKYAPPLEKLPFKSPLTGMTLGHASTLAGRVVEEMGHGHTIDSDEVIVLVEQVVEGELGYKMPKPEEE